VAHRSQDHAFASRPEAIPSLFAETWNKRDPNALASLFEEDAEFVNVTGLWWHDRASIRDPHAYGLNTYIQHLDAGRRRDPGERAFR
jgi:uncharacterized protein (TIGR02246 family)